MDCLKKIDLHVHAVPEAFERRSDGLGYANPQELRKMYDAIGVEKGVLLPPIAAAGAADTLSMREAAQMVEACPDTLGWWFCNIDPQMGDNRPDSDLSYFLRQYRDRGARGIGELTVNRYFDDPFMQNLYRHAQACGMPVLFHIGDMGSDYGLVDELGLPRLESMLAAFPWLTFIGHSQKFWAEISGDCTAETRGGYPGGLVAPGGRVVSLMRRYANLHADLSASSGYNAVTRDPAFGYAFLEEFQDRLYFGTDICAPENSGSDMLRLSGYLDAAVQAGRISDSAYEKISRGNALRLLGGTAAFGWEDGQ